VEAEQASLAVEAAAGPHMIISVAWLRRTS
jgi:hypothetical protein